MIYMVSFGVGFKCPRKIHLNTQWGGPLGNNLGRQPQPQVWLWGQLRYHLLGQPVIISCIFLKIYSTLHIVDIWFRYLFTFLIAKMSIFIYYRFWKRGRQRTGGKRGLGGGGYRLPEVNFRCRRGAGSSALPSSGFTRKRKYPTFRPQCSTTSTSPKIIFRLFSLNCRRQKATK